MTRVLENFVTGSDVELVGDVVVAASEDVSGIVAEFDSGETAFLSRELPDAFHLGQVPEASDTISRSGDEKVATELNSVDGTVVTSQSLNRLQCLAVPDNDAAVLGARDNVLRVKSDVENTTLVVLQTLNRFVGLDVPDNEVIVTGAGDEDLVVILQAKDGG